jgi:uncharacterized protein DUF3999
MPGVIRGHALAVALVLVGAAAAGAQPPREGPAAWTFRKPVTVPALSQPSFVELRLDADVARDAAATLSDLRLRDDTGSDVAYAVRRRERVAGTPTRETAMLDLVTTPEGAVRFVLDAGADGRRHGRVRLAIREQARNFRVPVRVELADDNRAWRIVRKAGFIYRVEGETKTADTSVSYPSSTARWLRLTVGPEKGRALPLAGAAIVLGDLTREEDRVPAKLVERDAESMRRTTRLVLDVRARRPADRVELDVAERTFQRVVLVEAGDDRKTWRWVGSGAISAVDVAGVRERLTSLRFPEATARYLRLTIQNLDDQPLTVTGARVFAVRRTLVFEAMPGRTYVLDYGNPRAPAPRDDARALSILARDALPTATLGSVRTVPVTAPTSWLASPPLATWATMAMAGLALASLGWRMVRGRSAAG